MIIEKRFSEIKDESHLRVEGHRGCTVGPGVDGKGDSPAAGRQLSRVCEFHSLGDLVSSCPPSWIICQRQTLDTKRLRSRGVHKPYLKTIPSF